MYDYLRGRLRQLGIRQQDLTPLLGVAQTGISRRMNNKIPWSLNEMYQLMDICRAPYEELHLYFPPAGKAIEEPGIRLLGRERSA